MTQSWKLALPAALALMVAGCATQPTPVFVPPPAQISEAPVVPPSASVTVPETGEAAPRSARRYRAARGGRGAVSAGPAGLTEQTTSGPSAVGRQPAAAQPVGGGGS